MYNGKVGFVAEISQGTRLEFPAFEFHPVVPGIEKVRIDGTSGNKIVGEVHLSAVPTHEEGRLLAMKVVEDSLNRIAFFHDVAIEKARNTGDRFDLSSAKPRMKEIFQTVEIGRSYSVTVSSKVSSEVLKGQLEQEPPSGERYYAFLRSARQSESLVEEFMHLYNILLMICGEEQKDVDAFIVKQDPKVQQAPRPDKIQRMETVFTRLRNEFAHKRPNVDLNTTKKEMARHLPALRRLTKGAIELNS